MKRIAAIAVVVAVLVAGTSLPAGAGLDDELSKVNSELARLRAEASSVRSERSELANLILDTGARLEAMAAELASAESRLADTDRDIALTEFRMEELATRMSEREKQVIDLGVEIDGIRDDAVERAVELYMQGQSASVVTLFQMEDITRFNVSLAYAARVQDASSRLISDLESLSVQQTRERNRLEAERLELAEEVVFLEFQREERASAAELVASRTTAVTGELAIQEEQLARLQAEVAEIEGELAALAREEAQIKALIIQQSNSGGTRPGALLRPVPGAVSSYYGYRVHPIYGDRRLHTGWDMNAGCSAPIVAAESGTVIFSGVKGGYGNAIIIDHGGGMSTLYAHQSRLGVFYGANVGIGDVIGWIGSTGVSTACHLHFEVRVNGDPVDPAPYM